MRLPGNCDEVMGLPQVADGYLPGSQAHWEWLCMLFTVADGYLPGSMVTSAREMQDRMPEYARRTVDRGVDGEILC